MPLGSDKNVDIAARTLVVGSQPLSVFLLGLL